MAYHHHLWRIRKRQRRWLVAFCAFCLVFHVRASNNNNNNDQALGYRNVEPFCRRSYIQVTGVWITCDTPGAYYYGGSAYRNSEVCMSGDKANILVDCK